MNTFTSRPSSAISDGTLPDDFDFDFEPEEDLPAAGFADDSLADVGQQQQHQRRTG